MTAAAKNQADCRRAHGRYYTPAFVVRYMLAGSLQPLLERRLTDGLPCRDSRPPLRILDPACGDGAFLLEAYEALQAWYLSRLVASCTAESGNPDTSGGLERTPNGWRLTPRCRLQIVRDHLYGVDVDAAAVKRLRTRIRKCIAPDTKLAGLTADVLAENLRPGNALTGPGFLPSEIDRADRRRRPLCNEQLDRPLEWFSAFPEAARDGGFDLVIGNPPYRREKDAKPQFDVIARTLLGRKWRQARMDLWYYFLHRGLDLLRPGGCLSFIVNSYWIASAGARKLIDRLSNEVTIDEIVLLGDSRIFADVSGRHVILRLHKEMSDRPTRIIDLQSRATDAAGALARITSEKHLLGNRPGNGVHDGTDESAAVVASNSILDDCGRAHIDSYEVPRGSLFEQNRLSLNRPDPWFDRFRGAIELGDLFTVRQGIAENPPFISARLAREFAGCTAGEGVFVLTRDELESLALTRKERSYLRPYFQTATIGRYQLPDNATHQILYLTGNTAPTLDGCPRLRDHLVRFRLILDRRRETRNGSIAWWQLHWPRVESLFTEPRVLSVQMGRRPQFVYAVRPTFVGFSVNLVHAKPRCSLQLPTLTGLLNSATAARWFERYAKKRGANLEINVGVLKRFPLPRIGEPELEERVSQLVLKRQQLECSTSGRRESRPAERTARITAIETEIDALVARLYCV